MSLALIYARSQNYCIGNNGLLPWRLPAEFAFFKRTTMDAAIIMGRKSYEDHNCELPGRLNIVITRQGDYPLASGVLRADSLAQARTLANEHRVRPFVIGGVGLFREALPIADTVFETIVDAHVDGDTFVDAFDFSRWDTDELLHHPADEEHAFSFTAYSRTRPT
ncbi:dihydrofolate reductase [Halioglobus maricola]|uniref:dihydrofolate reductase n=1 Tax=Halioglobus maricola TaxID=2601894 RepID=A0A5P9NKX1_9GAMM|nr:dihydrofolate reductase [Halioglobus maricola]QFU75598.1 dihydrofolate reductase [Halioglobus maricola]